MLFRSPHRGNEIAHMWDCLMETVNNQDFLFCAFQVIDWNADFSPWKSPAAFGDEEFKGNGPKTLQWLMNDLIPKLEADYGVDREIYLIGYSLAGLFALWTAYETDIFSAIASCSGSLWFEQWDEYVLHHQIKHESNIYLSLGGKEEKTKNPVKGGGPGFGKRKTLSGHCKSHVGTGTGAEVHSAFIFCSFQTV